MSTSMNVAEILTENYRLIPVFPARIDELFNTDSLKIAAFFDDDSERIERFRQMHENGMETFRYTFHFFLIWNQESKLIGECGFHHINKKHFRAELFYLLNNDNDKRKGVMSEVLPVVLDHGFEILGLHRVYAKIHEENEASLRLVRKFGFVHEGTLREDYFVNGVFESSELFALVK